MTNAQRRILGVFAHPDDETAGAGGAFARYSREGVQIHVATATRGERGELGTGGTAATREDLPSVREEEERSALDLLGVHPPMFLGYRDMEVARADFAELVSKVASLMERLKPDVVVTFGPTGITGHDDHKAMHRATVNAFHRYRNATEAGLQLMYLAVPEELARKFDLEVEGPEAEPNVLIDITDYIPTKVKALRMHGSQEDIQQLADLLEQGAFNLEWFHQAHPPLPDGTVSSSFWD